MSVTKDLKLARAALDKLNAYVNGLPKNSEPTKKYHELNTKANQALDRLPAGLRSTLAIDLSRIFIR